VSVAWRIRASRLDGDPLCGIRVGVSYTLCICSYAAERMSVGRAKRNTAVSQAGSSCRNDRCDRR
jgi:hypothetical protein